MRTTFFLAALSAVAPFLVSAVPVASTEGTALRQLEKRTDSKSNAVTSSGVKSFKGDNTNSIASWYRTNDPADHTNGGSWCYTQYTDSTPGFAISRQQMINDFNGDEMAARKAYCGLEAVVTTPEGRSETLYIADAFDDQYVRTPTSIDVIKGAFVRLYGRDTNNKDDVIQGVQWQFTGKRSSQWSFGGSGSA
ncbi:hypothetical protein JCM10296v2_001001 [Rhodotorula toruloides]